MSLQPLLIKNLPVRNDAAFESFTRNWLLDSGVKLEKLKDSNYNYNIQSDVRDNWIGELKNDADNVSSFDVFRLHVCVLLEFYIRGKINSSAKNYHYAFKLLDKVVELYERLLQIEREKVALLQIEK